MKLVKSVLSASILAAAAQTAVAVEIDPYASLQIMYVDETYSSAGYRDKGIANSYSRAGIKASETLDDLTLNYKFELAVDPTNDADNDFSDSNIRANVISVSGDFGNLAYGKQNISIYNNVVYGVGSDQFYGYYTGFEALGTTRIDNAVFYSSPEIDGMTISGSFSLEDSGTYEDNKELSVTYQVNDSIKVAAGVMDGANTAQEDMGLGIQYSKDGLTVNAAYLDKDNGATEYLNLYAGYSIDDANYIHAHVSDVDSTTDSTPFTLGFAHKYDASLTVFAEYYDDDSNGYPQVGIHYNF